MEKFKKKHRLLLFKIHGEKIHADYKGREKSVTGDQFAKVVAAENQKYS